MSSESVGVAHGDLTEVRSTSDPWKLQLTTAYPDQITRILGVLEQAISIQAGTMARTAASHLPCSPLCSKLNIQLQEAVVICSLC